MRYFAIIDQPGVICYHHVPGMLSVFGPAVNTGAIGVAHCVNWGDDGAALWALTVHGRRLPGEWIIVDREFRPAHDDGRQPRR